MMHVEPTWNHDAFFAYVDRWMTEDDTEFVNAIAASGRPAATDAAFGRFGRQGYVSGARWVADLWATYRDALPPAADGHVDPAADTTWH